MGFELKYYMCPKCHEQKLARNLDNGSFVCDNSEGGCTHRISAEENHVPYLTDHGHRVSGSGRALAEEVYKLANQYMGCNPMGSTQYSVGAGLLDMLRRHGYAT